MGREEKEKGNGGREGGWEGERKRKMKRIGNCYLMLEEREDRFKTHTFLW
jgi:hypothetical protein